jgi:hypothetical protein
MTKNRLRLRFWAVLDDDLQALQEQTCDDCMYYDRSNPVIRQSRIETDDSEIDTVEL